MERECRSPPSSTSLLPRDVADDSDRTFARFPRSRFRRSGSSHCLRRTHCRRHSRSSSSTTPHSTTLFSSRAMATVLAAVEQFFRAAGTGSKTPMPVRTTGLSTSPSSTRRRPNSSSSTCTRISSLIWSPPSRRFRRFSSSTAPTRSDCSRAGSSTRCTNICERQTAGVGTRSWSRRRSGSSRCLRGRRI